MYYFYSWCVYSEKAVQKEINEYCFFMIFKFKWLLFFEHVMYLKIQITSCIISFVRVRA